MNSLSWFLYLVDVSGSLAVFFGWICGLSALTGTLMLIIGSLMRDTSGYNYPSDEKIAIAKKMQKHCFWFIIPAFLFCMLAVLIPSKETFYMIAASEIGEKVIALEEVQEVGGEVGGLAKDAIKLLRERMNEAIVETTGENN